MWPEHNSPSLVESNAAAASKSGWAFRSITVLRRYALALLTLIVPAITTFAIGRKPALGSVLSLTYILAVAAAGWLAGPGPSIVVAFASVPVIAIIVSDGKIILPPHVDPVPMAVLILIGVMSSSVANARKRVEHVLRKSNLELEHKVSQRTAELERARSWLEITLSSIGDAVIATDRAGCITFLNPVAEKLTGWLAADAAGRPIGEVFVIVNEDTREPVSDPVLKVLDTGTITGLANHTVLIARDGREFSVDDSAAPIRDAQGDLAGVVLTFRDITERRSAEQLAESARVRLEQTNHELQQFAYAASHDLREPLRHISIYTQLLSQQYRGKLDDNADHVISVVLKGTRRMELLLKDLLAYTQASNDGDGEPGHSTDANLALSNVLATLSVSIGECGAKIDSGPLPKIPMDQVHLEQLLQNLIGNGIKYRAQRPPLIEVRAERNGNDWVFCVADNGIGIEAQYWEKVFGLFKRLHSSEEYEGTGIGLAICQKIVQRYGGRIWVESEPDRGSRFYFSVPGNAP